MFFIFSLVLVAVGVWMYRKYVLKTSKPDAVYSYASLGMMSVGGLMSVISVLAIVPPGHVGVATLFGYVVETAIPEGMHIVNPFWSIGNFSIRRHALEFQSSNKDNEEDSAVAVSKEGTHMTVDAVFPYQLNPSTAWKVYQKYGGSNEFVNRLLRPAARAAMRDAIQAFNWLEASTSKRELIADAMQKHFTDYVAKDLTVVGFSKEEVTVAFTFPPVQLRKILPPDQILSAVADKLAAQEELQKQRTMTEIANEVARRRTNEGHGIANLFSHLPRGFSPKEISTVLVAMADKQRADALEKAVNTGQAKVFVVNGQTPMAMSITNQ